MIKKKFDKNLNKDNIDDKKIINVLMCTWENARFVEDNLYLFIWEQYVHFDCHLAPSVVSLWPVYGVVIYACVPPIGLLSRFHLLYFYIHMYICICIEHSVFSCFLYRGKMPLVIHFCIVQWHCLVPCPKLRLNHFSLMIKFHTYTCDKMYIFFFSFCCIAYFVHCISDKWKIVYSRFFFINNMRYEISMSFLIILSLYNYRWSYRLRILYCLTCFYWQKN